DPQRVMQADVIHWQEDEQHQREDALTVEEPFEVRINRQALAVIMRTPGHDFELAMGFLFTEGVIARVSDVIHMEDALDDDGLPLANVVNVTLRPRGLAGQQVLQPQSVAFERHFAVSASCGLCGRNSIADLLLSTAPLSPDTLRISAKTLYTLAT